MTKQIFSALKIITLAVVLSFGLSYVYAWTAPTVAPTGGNVSSPLNTSGTAQSKAGSLGIGMTTTPPPATKLQVSNGNIQFDIPATSLANALITWPGGSPNFRLTDSLGVENINVNSQTGGVTYFNAGNVGIGTVVPYSTLNIAGDGAAKNGKGLILGTIGESLLSGGVYGPNPDGPVGSELGRFEIGFPGYRDCEEKQIGGKIAAIRKNNYVADYAYVQSTDLAFFTGSGSGGLPPSSNGCDSLSQEFHDTSAEQMRILANGYVGIGTVAPTQKLDVAGNINATGDVCGGGKCLSDIGSSSGYICITHYIHQCGIGYLEGGNLSRSTTDISGSVPPPTGWCSGYRQCIPI